MMKIEKLTPQQEAKMAEYRDKWMEIGLSTEPADRPRAEKAVQELYTEAGLKQPQRIIWTQSPLGAQLLLHILKNEKLCQQIGQKLGATVRATVRATVWDTGIKYDEDFFWCQFDSGWMGWAKYYAEVLEIKYPDKADRRMELWQELGQSCGLVWFFENAAVICERPSRISFQDSRTLHCENGPAIEYRDGFKIWMLEQVRVTEQIVLEPETLNREQIDGEEDMEVRRIMIERYGAGKYLMEIGAKYLDVDALQLEGSATRALFEDNKGLKFLVGSDGSTSKIYYMNVPQEVNTCKEAHESIAGFSEDRLQVEA